MSEPFAFTYAPSADEYFDAIAARKLWKWIGLTTLLLFGIVIVPFGALAFRDPDEARSFSVFPVLLVVALVLPWILIVRALVSYLRRSCKEQAARTEAEVLQVMVSTDGLETRSANTASTIFWPAFASVRTTKKNVVLELRSGGTFAIPLRYLDEQAQRLIRESVANRNGSAT